METSIDEYEESKSLTVTQFIKGHEAAGEVLKKFKECARLNTTQYPSLSKYMYNFSIFYSKIVYQQAYSRKLINRIAVEKKRLSTHKNSFLQGFHLITKKL